jgi:glycosyltransferase A (GT-A) superfamily protein (DUF2064 family)
MKVGIAIFVKTPGNARVKTRLAATIGQRAAAEWYRLSLRAVASVLREVISVADVPVYWVIAEASALDDPSWREFPRIVQTEHDGKGLGERMGRVHSELVARHGAGLLIGVDTPQMSPAHLIRAINWIDHASARAAIGPSRDGGFWLFGGNHAMPLSQWTQPAYNQPDTCAEFELAMQAAGGWLTLPTLTDVDLAEDLPSLRNELLDQPALTQEQDAMLAWLDEREAQR